MTQAGSRFGSSSDQTCDAVSAEEELALRLAGVAAMRVAEHDRILELAAHVNSDALISLLENQRLLALLGSRLVEICDDLVSSEVRQAVEYAAATARRRHTLSAHMVRDFDRRLERAGITTLPLKGPLLAERLYEDPGLRDPPHDLDFLVHRQQLDDAVQLFTDLGYTLWDDSLWSDGLPHYHYCLSPGTPRLPKVELHWRIHWYEKDFAGRVIDSSLQGCDGVRTPSPAHDLAMLLIIFVRDGLVGLRLAADIGAWWDGHATEVTPLGLDGILEDYPRLRPAMLAALDAAEQLVGLPRDELVSSHWRTSHRSRAATRLLNWRGRGTRRDVEIKITLIELLLTPPAAARVYIRHHWFQPRSKYVRDYGWNPEARLTNELRRTVHVLARIAKSARNYSRQLWTVRRGANFDPRPARLAPPDSPSSSPGNGTTGSLRTAAMATTVRGGTQ